jgi:hypothetical protein
MVPVSRKQSKGKSSSPLVICCYPSESAEHMKASGRPASTNARTRDLPMGFEADKTGCRTLAANGAERLEARMPGMRTRTFPCVSTAARRHDARLQS